MSERRPLDIGVRLPNGKKKNKTELAKIAKANGITLNKLMICIIEWFLEERKNKDFRIKLM